MKAHIFSQDALLAGALRERALMTASGLMDAVSGGVRRLPQRARYLPADAITAQLTVPLLRRRPIIERNFAAILGAAPDDPRVYRLARLSIRNFGRMAIDFLAARTMSEAEVLRWITPAGADYLAEAFEHGRGVIMALAHHGSWDVAAAFAQAYGCKLTVVTESNWMAELVAGSRTGRGVTLAPRDRSPRALFRALARNECVAIVCDIAEDEFQTAAVPFFGRPAPLPLGPARLARHMRSPILVVSNVRQSDGSYRITGQPLLWADQSLPEDEAVRALTASVAAGFERIVAACPAQWYPFHPIWPDEAKSY